MPEPHVPQPSLPQHIQELRKKQAQKATLRQNMAMVPSISAQVAASAGTGKTHVLTRRFLRLLLADKSLKPSEVLAVTYTKAGATEMHNRLTAMLSAWATAPRAKLFKELTVLLNRAPQEDELQHAQRLFLDVLDDPIGLRVLTVHGFCQSMLAQFPLEAGINTNFAVLEAEEAKNLLLEEMHKTYTLLANTPTHKAYWAFTYLISQLADKTLGDEFSFYIENRRRFENMFLNAGGVPQVLIALQVALNISVADTPENTPENTFNHLKKVQYKEVCTHKVWLKKLAQSLMEDGGKKAVENSRKIYTFLEGITEGAGTTAEGAAKGGLELGVVIENMGVLSSVFQNQNGSFRKSLVPSSVKKQNPEIAEEALAFYELLKKQQDIFAAFEVYFKTAAFLTLADEVRSRYAQAKVEANKLDFEDLVRLSRHLLTSDSALNTWVRYKMDGRIAHIMLDEAQDTDSDQWQIIKALMDDFFTGQGRHTAQRTFFAVGDSKQAIYRFRGAERYIFEGMLNEVNAFITQEQQKIKPVALDTSFRSSQVILKAVDVFFETPAMHQALGTDAPLHHEAFHIGAGGEVCLWPLPQAAPEGDAPKQKLQDRQQGWVLPFTEQEGAQPSLKETLFADLAAHIKKLVVNAPFLATEGRPLRVGDVMVLCRTNEDVGLFLAALTKAGVHAARSGKVVLAESPIVQDLLALLKFLANPADDLALAHLLRGPIFAFDDQNLEALRQTKKIGLGSLFKALCTFDEGVCYTAARTLKKLLNKVDFYTPHQLLLEALYQTEGVGRFVQRYVGVADLQNPAVSSLHQVVEAFLENALHYSQQQSSVLGFLEQFIQSGASLNLQIPEGVQAVQIMTMHGSKGLQAPVVILPEVGANMYRKINKEQKLWQVNAQTKEDELFLFGIPKDRCPPLQDSLREAEKQRIFEDEMRLLYVALTRAQEQLIIAAEKSDEESWYAKLHTAFSNNPLWEEEESGALRYKEPHLFEGVQNIQLEGMQLEEGGSMSEAVPPWVYAEPPLPAVAPVATWSEKLLPVKVDKTSEQAMERGVLIHRLLEILPNFTEEEWPERAQAFLAAKGLSFEECTHLCDEALAVLGTFKPLFTGRTYSEATLVFKEAFKENADIATFLKGRVDLLKVEDNTVTIIDFKTDRAAQKNGQKEGQKMPPPYRKQLQHYKALAQKLWPEKTVKCGILWTVTRELLWLDETL